MKIDRVYHSNVKQDRSWIKYLDGIDAGRYITGWSGQYIKYGKNLSRSRTPNLFMGERLLIRQIPSSLPYCINGCYLDEHAINDNNSMIIKTYGINLKYILGIINSKLISFWFYHTFGKLQRKIFPQFKVKELRTFPIKSITISEQQPLITLVNQILVAKKKDPNADTSALERQIDKMVYALYCLTPEEIAIAEGKG